MQQNLYPIPFKEPYFSIDVECVATGYDHNSRAVAQIALVDQYEQVGSSTGPFPACKSDSCMTACMGLTLTETPAPTPPTPYLGDFEFICQARQAGCQSSYSFDRWVHL